MAVRIARQPGWELRLYDLISSAARKPFKWGGHDCCLWAADNFEALTLIDPAVPVFRGQYRTEFQARERMQRYCGGGPFEVLRRIGWLFSAAVESCDKLRPGDPVCAFIDGDEVLGAIDISGHALSVVTQAGLGVAPMEHATVGLRIV